MTDVAFRSAKELAALIRSAVETSRPLIDEASAEYVKPRFAFMQKRKPAGVSAAHFDSVDSGGVR